MKKNISLKALGMPFLVNEVEHEANSHKEGNWEGRMRWEEMAFCGWEETWAW